MKFELEEDFIELFKLLKVTGVAESGGQAKMLIEEGVVKRNGEVELRKRAKNSDCIHLTLHCHTK